jgi:hypothetical protein
VEVGEAEFTRRFRFHVFAPPHITVEGAGRVKLNVLNLRRVVRSGSVRVNVSVTTFSSKDTQARYRVWVGSQGTRVHGPHWRP